LGLPSETFPLVRLRLPKSLTPFFLDSLIARF
jgi:hypothetical protein